MSSPALLAPENAHALLLAGAARRNAFDPSIDPDIWRHELRTSLESCLGLKPEQVPLDPRWDAEEPCPGGNMRRFSIAVEPGQRACGWLLRPAGTTNPPVMICLQGHSTGAHISIGRAIHPGDAESIAGDRDFALQALSHGYAALAIEQRAFGARSDQRPQAIRGSPGRGGCTHATLVALLLGRSMVRERTWDVSRAIDLLEMVGDVDTRRIGCMGNSGGGTITWYATAIEPRIAALMPSCSICPYAESIGSIDHCADNYLPGALRFFDMPDLAGLLAPRPCVVVAGREDSIFPFAAIERGFSRISSIYAAAGASAACRLAVGTGGHRFYATEGWTAFRDITPNNAVAPLFVEVPAGRLSA